MGYLDMREELTGFYFEGTGERGEEFRQKIYAQLDAQYKEGMSPYQMKEMQYRAIAEAFEPVLFYTCPFYFEMGTMWAHCDGGRDFRGFRHAGGWTYEKNKHLFKDQDPELYALKKRQTE